MAERAPSWFADPDDPALARWHDGRGWTDFTMVVAEWTSAEPPPPPAGWSPEPSPTEGLTPAFGAPAAPEPVAEPEPAPPPPAVDTVAPAPVDPAPPADEAPPLDLAPPVQRPQTSGVRITAPVATPEPAPTPAFPTQPAAPTEPEPERTPAFPTEEPSPTPAFASEVAEAEAPAGTGPDADTPTAPPSEPEAPTPAFGAPSAEGDPSADVSDTAELGEPAEPLDDEPLDDEPLDDVPVDDVPVDDVPAMQFGHGPEAPGPDWGSGVDLTRPQRRPSGWGDDPDSDYADLGVDHGLLARYTSSPPLIRFGLPVAVIVVVVLAAVLLLGGGDDDSGNLFANGDGTLEEDTANEPGMTDALSAARKAGAAEDISDQDLAVLVKGVCSAARRSLVPLNLSEGLAATGVDAAGLGTAATAIGTGALEFCPDQDSTIPQVVSVLVARTERMLEADD